MGHEAGDAVGDVGGGEIEAGGLGGGEFFGVLEEAPEGGEGAGCAEGGEDVFGGIGSIVGGGEAGDDKVDEEFLDLGEGGDGGIGEGGGEEGPGEEKEEEGCPWGVFCVTPLADGEEDGDAKANLGNGDGGDAGGEGGTGGEDGPIVSF